MIELLATLIVGNAVAAGNCDPAYLAREIALKGLANRWPALQRLYSKYVQTSDNAGFLNPRPDQGAETFVTLVSAVGGELNNNLFKQQIERTTVLHLMQTDFFNHQLELELWKIGHTGKFTTYLDGKVIGVRISGRSPEIDAAIARAADQSGNYFAQQLANLGIATPGELEAAGLRGHALSPDSWYFAGIGNTPEEAYASARTGRIYGLQHDGKTKSFWGKSGISKKLAKEFSKTETARASLESNPKRAAKLVAAGILMGEPGQRTLSDQVLMAFREVKTPRSEGRDVYLKDLQAAIPGGEILTMDEVRAIAEYRGGVTTHMMGHSWVKDWHPGLDNGRVGSVLGGDLIRAGLENERRVMQATAGRSSVEEVIQLANQAQTKATAEFFDPMRQAMVEFYGRVRPGGTLDFRGEDARGYAPRTSLVQETDYKKALQWLGKEHPTKVGRMRLALVTHTDHVIDRPEHWVGLALDAEKALRSRLRSKLDANGQRVWPDDRLDKLGLASLLRPPVIGQDGSVTSLGHIKIYVIGLRSRDFGSLDVDLREALRNTRSFPLDQFIEPTVVAP